MNLMVDVSRQVRRTGSRIGAVALAVVALSLLVSPAPASAATVGGCTPWWSSQNPYVCVGVDTGAKNYSNGTQWVSTVTVRTALEPSRLEAWIGNGPTGVAWYATASGTHVSWWVNRWVKSGSGICGAYYHRYGGRSVACISIKV